MSAAEMRTVDVQGWPVAFLAGDDEPRIRDLDLGERLGFDRPRDIRKLIERMAEGGKITGIHVRATVARTSMPRGGDREVTVNEYYLTEAQALKVAAKSETDPADALLDEMIKVYMLARRGQLVAPRRDRLHLSLLSQSRGAMLRGDGHTARVLIGALDELLSGQRSARVAPVEPTAPADQLEKKKLSTYRPTGKPNGRPKSIAAMSSDDFRAACQRVGGNIEMALIISRTYKTVGYYSSGRLNVPGDVADVLSRHLAKLAGAAEQPAA